MIAVTGAVVRQQHRQLHFLWESLCLFSWLPFLDPNSGSRQPEVESSQIQGFLFAVWWYVAYLQTKKPIFTNFINLWCYLQKHVCLVIVNWITLITKYMVAHEWFYRCNIKTLIIDYDYYSRNTISSHTTCVLQWVLTRNDGATDQV